MDAGDAPAAASDEPCAAPCAVTVEESVQAPSSAAPPAPAQGALSKRLGDKAADSLLRQVEYYFSDLSFPYDSFLQGEANADGAVSACTLAGAPAIINKLPQLSAAERAAAIIEAAGRSDSVQLVSDGEGGVRIARIYPLPAADEAKHRFDLVRSRLG